MKKNLMLAAMVFAMAGMADLPTSYSTTNVMDWIGVDINFSNAILSRAATGLSVTMPASVSISR